MSSDGTALFDGAYSPSFSLNLDNAFEYQVMEVVAMFRQKNAQYAGDSADVEQAFVDIAADAGTTPLDACETLGAKHRLSIKRFMKDRRRSTYSDDGFLDRAVYAIHALCLYRREVNQ